MKHTDAIRMTCVFAYNVRDFQKNPFFVDTPFGRPVIVSVGDVCSERDDLETERDELRAALENLLTYDLVERPAFRSKPEGAPGSTVRIQQDKLIALEDAARAILAKVQS